MAIPSTSKLNACRNNSEMLPLMLDSPPARTFAPGAQSTPLLRRSFKNNNGSNCQDMNEETTWQNIFDNSPGSFLNNFTPVESPAHTGLSGLLQRGASPKGSPSWSFRKRGRTKHGERTPKREEFRVLGRGRNNIATDLSNVAGPSGIQSMNRTNLKHIVKSHKKWDDDSFDDVISQDPHCLNEIDTVSGTLSGVYYSKAIVTADLTNKRKKYENGKLRSKPCLLPKTDTQPIGALAQAQEAGMQAAKDCIEDVMATWQNDSWDNQQEVGQMSASTEQDKGKSARNLPCVSHKVSARRTLRLEAKKCTPEEIEQKRRLALRKLRKAP
uniref:uncharacterized protein n=1 Tax=Myxine glutinosa TaxID=7769 RepID=UPI00358F2E02